MHLRRKKKIFSFSTIVFWNKNAFVYNRFINFQKGEVEVVSVDSSMVTHVSSVRLHCPSDLRSKDARKGMHKAVKEVKRRFPEGPPLLNPIKDMKINDPEFEKIVTKIENLEKR